MEKKYSSIDEVLSLPRLSGVRISPNGKNVAYVKRTTDWEENEFRNTIWVYEDGKHYPIINGKREATDPAWSPDNSMLAYLADCSEKSKDKDKDKDKKQIFLKTYDENNGVQLTHCNSDIKFLKWSPDGRGIYYLATEAESVEMKNRKKQYGDFKIIDKDYNNNVLYYIELEKAIAKANLKPILNEKLEVKQEEKLEVKQGEKLEARQEENPDLAIQITDPKAFNVSGFDVSLDLKSILLVTTTSSQMKDCDNTELLLLSLDSMEIRKLKYDGIISNSIGFSLDNTAIAFSKTPHDKAYYNNKIDEDRILEAYHLISDKKIMDSSSLDRDVELIKWTDKGPLIFWQEKTYYKAGFMQADGEIKALNEDEDCYIESIDITSDGENVACIKANDKKTFEVYLNNKQVTNENKWYENKQQSQKVLVNWSILEGSVIEGVLSLPEEFDETKKYPLLVVIHGGPTWASFLVHDMSKLYPIEEFVEKGYIVLEPNYRGSSGYGNEFRISNYRNLGVGDYEDVISGVDMLIEKGYVDKDRVGVMGWSQGGYISAMCSTYSNRFKAISVGAGISNWMTYYVNTDITSFTLCYLGANPWDDPEIYSVTSPMTYIKQANTPTLIQHGDKDARVPLPNAYELYRGLKDVGVVTELVTYDGMGHSPDKPRLMKAIMEQNLNWFIKYI